MQSLGVVSCDEDEEYEKIEKELMSRKRNLAVSLSSFNHNEYLIFVFFHERTN